MKYAISLYLNVRCYIHSSKQSNESIFQFPEIRNPHRIPIDRFDLKMQILDMYIYIYIEYINNIIHIYLYKLDINMLNSEGN